MAIKTNQELAQAVNEAIKESGIRIGTTPAALLQDKDQGIIILKDRMFDCFLFHPAGMH